MARVLYSGYDRRLSVSGVLYHLARQSFELMSSTFIMSERLMDAYVWSLRENYYFVS